MKINERNKSGSKVNYRNSKDHFHTVSNVLSDEEIAFIEGVFGMQLIELYGINN
ncbi:hypothetical protein [Aliivibrio sifiae]|uniref:Uncharacterized protein n=1 Tax=Aliivibrio sifiae TaxID=566293 RepID=A0ABQ6AGG5_9GAMM|nr:hypothetical protein [Aliivibrio sifiae]GLR73792.1 hypothetical protein GCM10007855_06660 [Aliivibrio sifiae]